MSSGLLEKGYEPSGVEKHWYEFWEKEELFTSGKLNDKKSFSIVIPPPNVTGVLHMGHALNVTLQDILCRYRRMRGDNVLWMPGTDHAGIATQNVVEKKLAAENTDRHKLGRENFIKAVWEWRNQYGSAIINQLKRLGASCDWKLERFTMDEGLSLAVRKVFVQLYNEGLIYRGNYIINWCHRCHTALADLEVEYEEIDGHLYYIRYPFKDGSGGIVVATTRPETMLGDSGVAVNPDDSRYQDMKSSSVLLPILNREIPIITDAYVDKAFGTGALKVTPAHDPNDFEIGKRHGLPEIKVIDDNGRMTSDAGKFEGLERFECRKAVVKALKEEGLLEKIEPIKHNVGHCYRCKTIIEPNLSKQWFVKVKPLAEKAIEAVKNKSTRIIPEIWANTYFEWMNNIRDWCISRQIWWGHQIPAWTCEKCLHLVVSMEPPSACPKCKCSRLVQETDVLDTWFSSALWPFSTLGWPEETWLLKTFYPTSVLVTGFDILFFWVARMMMMGMHFMNDVPFKDVYVHALVRDEDGKKMSKSKGNVIDPLSIIDKYGTDSFRMTLAVFAAQGRDVKMSEKRVEGYRHFVNKLWNASRFSLMHLTKSHSELKFENMSLPDKWILARLKNVTDVVSDAIDSYRFNDAANTLYKFVWHELCDWYLEAVKPCLYGHKGEEKKDAALSVLQRVFHDVLILLHPFIPFVTEEIWHKLPGTKGSIMKAVFPSDVDDFESLLFDSGSESAMNKIMEIITGIRNIRGEMNISPSVSLNVILHTDNDSLRNMALNNDDIIINLAGLKSIVSEKPGKRPKKAATSVIGDAVIYILLEEILDFAKEKDRLEKELAKLKNEMAALVKKLNNEDFLKKAPDDIVDKVKDKYNLALTKQQKLISNLEKIKSIEAE